MTEFPIIYDEFFWPIRLNELLDWYSKPVQDFASSVNNSRELADKVISEIQYPFYLGQPDDTHVLNCFHGKWCKKIELDFFQPASWTASLKIGDCEDGSILYVAGSMLHLVSDADVYVVFGYVLDEVTRQFLGGHAWVYIRNISFGDTDWHYVETTLDTPPKTYPKVRDITKPFTYEGVVLVPEILWNATVYKELNINEDLINPKIIGSDVNYLRLKKKQKETKKKYLAIERAFKKSVKPIKASKKSIMAKIRWRH